MIRRIPFLILWLSTIILPCCNDNEMTSQIPGAILEADTMPRIILWGQKTDTAFLYTNYEDPGSEIRASGKMMDCSGERAEVSGTVDTRIPGIYYLYYNFTNNDGLAAKTLTRTVHVVENDAGFLNGTYEVACTCTATTRGTNKQTTSATHYTATIFPEKRNRQFRLLPLHLGAEYVVPNSQLSGDSMYIGYFTPDYYRLDILARLSGTKTTFTVESTGVKYSPAVTYHCKNVFTKQLVLNAEKNTTK